MASTKELMLKLERARSTMKGMRESMTEYTEKTVETATTIGGGALAGWVESEYPGKEIFGINAGLAVGAGLTVVGVMEWAGKQSAILGAAGTGMLAYEAGRRVAARNASSGVGMAGDGRPVSIHDVMRAANQRAA